MDIIKCILVAFLLFIFFYETGWILNRKLQRINITNVSVGFIATLAMFQIIALPFMWFEMKFTILYIICLLFIGAVTVYTLVNIKIDIKKISKISFVWIIALGMIVLQMIGYIVLQHSDADDAFFVSQISTILQTNYINKIDCTTGMREYMFIPQYKLVGWEVLLSIFCKLFQMSAATFCHTCLPLVLLVIHYSTVWNISKELHPDKPIIPLILMEIINVFGNYSVYTRESFLFLRIWQGKAVYVNIVLPMFLLLFLKLFNDCEETKNEIIILLAFVLFASLNTTIVGIYLGPLAYGVYVLTYTLYSKSIRNFWKLCIPVFCILPNVIIKFLYLIKYSAIEENVVGADSFDWMSWLFLVIGNRWYLIIIFIMLMGFIIVKGGKAERYLFGIYPILGLVTYLNPMLAKYVSGHITGVAVYWRLFWNLQLSFIVLDAVLIVWRTFKYKIIAVLMLVGIIVCQNGFIYTKENFDWIKNPEKVNEISRDIVISLDQEVNSDDIVLLAPEEYTYDIRQMTGKIKIAWSRYIHPDNLVEIYEQLYSEKSITKEKISKLKGMGVNYLVLYSSTDISQIIDKNSILIENKDVILVRI